MIRMGIIGTGNISTTHAEAITNSKKLELVAISGRNREKGMAEAEKYNCKYYSDTTKLLQQKDIDAVVIALPTFLHEQYTILAARYGKNVVCEKPVCMTLEAYEHMVSATQKAGVKFMVAQVIRFWPEYVDIKKRYDAGEFGEIKMIIANRLAQHPNWGDWFFDPTKGGTGLFDLHLHDIDFVHYLIGMPKSVYAIGWQNARGAWNHIVSNLVFSNGVKACIEGAFEMTDYYPFQMNFRIVGSDVTEEYNFSAGLNLEDIGNATRREIVFGTGKHPINAFVNINENAYQNELEYFADCIEKNKDIDLMTIESARNTLRIILGVKESLETGRIVEL